MSAHLSIDFTYPSLGSDGRVRLFAGADARVYYEQVNPSKWKPRQAETWLTLYREAYFHQCDAIFPALFVLLATAFSSLQLVSALPLYSCLTVLFALGFYTCVIYGESSIKCTIAPVCLTNRLKTYRGNYTSCQSSLEQISLQFCSFVGGCCARIIYI